MTTSMTHDELTQAITAYRTTSEFGPPLPRREEVQALLDLCAAVLHLHRERPDVADLLKMPGHTYVGDTSCHTCWQFWPCPSWEPTAALVESTLRKVGALT